MGRLIWILTKRTYLEYARDHCTQHAAAVTYYVLFSMLPLAIFVLSIFGLFLSNEEIRTDVVDGILDALPLSETEGRDQVEEAVQSVSNVSGIGVAVSFIVLLWSASAMFGSLRRSLNTVWGVEEERPWLQGKFVDFSQIGVLSIGLLASIVATGALRTARELSSDIVGPLAYNSPLWELPPLLLPGVLTMFTLTVMYRVVPAAHPRWRDVIPGALVATLLFEVLKNTFAIYVANFNNFDVIYGSLGGILLFLLYAFLTCNVVLIGAELSHTMQRFRTGELDSEIYPIEPMPPVAVRAFRAVMGLFVRQ